jgi:hypothetical protein
VSESGDALTAEWYAGDRTDAWKSGTGFRANAARWKLALLTPESVARAADAFAEASEELGQRIAAAGGWDPRQAAAEYDAWKQAEHRLISAARDQLGPGSFR